MDYTLVTAIGLRVHPNRLGQLRLPEGGYGRDLQGRWLVRPPLCDTVALAPSDVMEFTNDTLSCLRPILGRGVAHAATWRLDRGVWTCEEAQQQAEANLKEQ